MPKLIDVPIGTKFNRWTVIQRDTTKKRGFWLCQCDCGNPELRSIDITALKSGRSKSCGKCGQYDEIGKIYGRLKVLEVDLDYKEQHKTKVSGYYYKCQCSCENKTIITVSGINLRNGHTKSCGCLIKEGCNKKDLTGQIFGFLKVLYPTEQRTSSYITWHCLCLNCNNECDVISRHLIDGRTSSCGCLRSVGEANIKKILQDNQIDFSQEKTFLDLINPDTQYLLRYDFYLSKFNRLIEFDGEQHFKYKKGNCTWNNEENYLKTVHNDKIKNDYAKQHNIPLVRIPYWERDNITLDMLLGDQYLIKE